MIYEVAAWGHYNPSEIEYRWTLPQLVAMHDMYAIRESISWEKGGAAAWL